MQITQNNTIIETKQETENIFIVNETSSNDVIKQYEVLNLSLTDNSKIIQQYVAGESINGHRAVVVIDSELFHADSTNISHMNKVIGISLNAGSIGDAVTVQIIGDVYQLGWGLIANSYYYYDSIGLLTTAKPNIFIQSIGYAKDSNTMIINKSQSIGLI